MMRTSRRLWVALLYAWLLLAPTAADAQEAEGSGDWGAFTEVSLTDFDRRMRQNVWDSGWGERDGLNIAAVPLPTRTEMTFEGEARPVPPGTALLLRSWFAQHDLDSSLNNYKEEWLFREGDEGGATFWMPIRGDIAAVLRGTLKQGDRVTIGALYVGALVSKGEMETSFSIVRLEPITDHWDRYRPGTLQAIVERVSPGLGSADGYYLAGDSSPTRATLNFVGQVRPIREDVKQLMDRSLLLQRYEGRRPAYDEEWLFREGQTNYWLPVQAMTAESMREVVKPGDPVTVWVQYWGAILSGGRKTWVFPMFKTVSYDR
jgi:hypothetical protein